MVSEKVMVHPLASVTTRSYVPAVRNPISSAM